MEEADGRRHSVFRRELEAACPALPGFISLVGNKSHDVHSKEPKVQQIMNLIQQRLGKGSFKNLSEVVGLAAADDVAMEYDADDVWEEVWDPEHAVVAVCK